ncbi:Neuronal pentraxin receptor [Plecturocebus cupreus]
MVTLDSDLTSGARLNCDRACGARSAEPHPKESSLRGGYEHNPLREGARATEGWDGGYPGAPPRGPRVAAPCTVPGATLAPRRIPGGAPSPGPGTERVRGWARAGPGKRVGRGRRARSPSPRQPPSPPPAARAQSGGSSGRGDSCGSGSGSRACPPRPRAPGLRAPTPPQRLPGASGAPAARLTLKFLAVLLAAGMLAFLGAVICIIASVPLAASPARALPGGADNASVASGAAASPGPQRSLSALHGAGGSAGPPALPGAPAASAHPLPPGPLFSRFLCTPLAAACPSGAQQGDAAGAAPGEREELLLLQSTAEQLRQTALQQEARIRADQDTIRELTGKLGRCESGLPRGLQGAGPRRDTMADGSWDSPALILELEDAVRALRDRIDRLEVSAARRRGSRRGGGRDRPAAAASCPRASGLPSVFRGRSRPPRWRGGGGSVKECGQASGTVTEAQGARQKGSLLTLFPLQAPL